MWRLVPSRRFQHWLRCAAMLGALATGLALAPATALADGQQVVLQRGREDLAVGEMLFRAVDTTLPAGQPAVTHSHASGFDYAVEGAHVLGIRGSEVVAAQGQATWVGPQQEHSHGSLNRAGMRFWFIAFRPASTRGAPPVWPYPSTRIRGESENVPVAATGPYDLVLSEIRLPSPGDAIGPLARTGPVGITVVVGEVRLGGQALPTEGVVVQYPGDTRTFTNASSGPSRFLALAVTPAAAAPTQLPRTGGPGRSLAAPALAAAALAVGLALRRRCLPHAQTGR
jgi:quercetin dioxygenase-like cupin family protein